MKKTQNEVEEVTVILPLSQNEVNAKIDQFVIAFAEGKAAFEKAGKLIVELVDSDPHAYDYIVERAPSMTPQLIRIFEDIGRGHVLPSLAFDSSPAARLMKRFPLPQQRRLESEAIPLVVRKAGGGTDVRLVKLCDMTKDQQAQAISRDRLRTEGEQRALMDEQLAKAAIIEVKAITQQMPYQVKGGVVVFTSGAKLDRKQVLAILNQLG